MALEASSKTGLPHSFAVNTGTDGDLTKHWHFLPGCAETLGGSAEQVLATGIDPKNLKVEDKKLLLGPEAGDRVGGVCAQVTGGQPVSQFL